MYCSPNFTKVLASNGKPAYFFQICLKQLTDSELPDIHAVGGVWSSNEEDETTRTNLTHILPENTHDPLLWKPIYDMWISDCSGAFVKPPTIQQCLANTTVEVDTKVKTFTIAPEEMSKDWQVVWTPTRIKVDSPQFIIYWAATHKRPYTRPIEKISMEDQVHEIEVQNPEKSYSFVPQTSRLYNGEWLQELQDVPLPLSDSPALRLDVDLEAQREKWRRKVRDSRIRAKLARYRAERMAQRYEERFGTYPSEDEEEAQTEAETGSEE